MNINGKHFGMKLINFFLFLVTSTYDPAESEWDNVQHITARKSSSLSFVS